MDLSRLPLSEPTRRGRCQPMRLSTREIPFAERNNWLRDVICREYANVEVTSPACQILSQDLTIYPWDNLRLSIIRSSGIALERLPREPHLPSQDAYFAVVVLSGDYALEQDGREAVLRPGDMVIYDATRPHKVHCPNNFEKLIVSIPRPLLRARNGGAEYCVARRISGAEGIGAVASEFIRSSSLHAESFSACEFSTLADHALDLVTLAAASVRPTRFSLSRYQALSIQRIKVLIENCLRDSELDATAIAHRAGLSARYINTLFSGEGTSLMRYVWTRRLEHCAKELSDPARDGEPVAEIAYRWGFNDAAHFSRAFKQQFGCAPREFRRRRQAA